MATKKQKHAAGLAKRETFMKQVEADGLAALKKSKELEEKALRKAKSEAEDRIQRQRLRPTDEKDITVGEFLELARELMPVFSDR